MNQTLSQQHAAKFLRLNLWGQIAITVFSNEAIEYGISQCKLFKDAKNQFAYFHSQARQHCIKNGVSLNYTRCYDLQQQHNMPASIDISSSKDLIDETMPQVVQELQQTKFYSHKEIVLDHNEQCRQWHDMVVNWDAVVDVKKKCAKGYELTYPGYLSWMSKIPLSTLLDQDLPDTLLYIDESKTTLLDAINSLRK